MLREATIDDAPRIWELILELAEYERLMHLVTGSAEKLREDIAKGTCEISLAVDEDTIVGYALRFRTYSTFKTQSGTWLEDLYIQPTHRGKGLGKALLQHVLQVAEGRIDGRVEWAVLDWNVSAIEFYKAMGADLVDDWRLCRVTL